MPRRSFEFADAIKQIWNTLKGLEDKPASLIKDELFFEMNEQGLLPARSRDQVSNPLDYWGKGYVPSDLRVVDFLAEVGVRRAKLPPEWLNRFLQAAGYSQALRQERARALYSDAPPLPHRPCNLPARRGDFLGRQAELEWLLETLNSGWPVCLVEGIGGVGKTTLALEVAYACTGQPRGAAVALAWPKFPFIVWTSAEKGSLTLHDLLDAVAYRLNYPALTQKPLDEKGRVVNDLLAQQPVLLIVDNFETISDPGVADFVVRVPSTVKVLLTSREKERLLAPIFERYPPARIRLGGLPDAEALAFLRQQAQYLANRSRKNERARLEAVTNADDATLKPLIQATGGNPKALALALGHIRDNATPLKTLVRDLYAAADSVARLFDYFFQRAWERCSEDARALWRVVPFFAGSARREALAAAAGLRGRYFYDALEEVRGRSLLEVEERADGEPRYRAHPLVRAFAAARLRDAPDFETQARERWVEWYTEFLPQPIRSKEDWPIFVTLDTEQENVLAAIEWALADGHPRAPVLVQRIWRFLYVRGHWRQCETFVCQALEQATIQKDTPRRLWLASHLGWHLSRRGQVSALEQLHQIETEILALGQIVLLKETNVLNYLGQVYSHQGDLERAEAYQARCLDLAEEFGDRHSSLVARYYLTAIRSLQGKMDEAEQQYSTLVAEAQNIEWKRAEGYCAHRLSVALIYLDRLDEAEQWLSHVGKMADHWQEPFLQAHVLFGRAQLQGRCEKLDEAHSLAQAALDLYQRLETRPDIKKVIEFLADLDGSYHP